jgi:hypothetical protein
MPTSRLTFDANPKELASRSCGPTRISLLWSRRTHRAGVVVQDDATGEIVELDVRERENALDVYEHALAYLPRRGHPGRPPAPPHAAAA